MQFELTKTYLEQLKAAIEDAHPQFILDQIAELHAADIADILDALNKNEAEYLYQLIEEEEKAADVLIELEDERREELLSSLSSKEIADQVIENIESDDAADVIGELSEEKKEEVISHIEDQEQASDIVDLLQYDEIRVFDNCRHPVLNLL